MMDKLKYILALCSVTAFIATLLTVIFMSVALLVACAIVHYLPYELPIVTCIDIGMATVIIIALGLRLTFNKG